MRNVQTVVATLKKWYLRHGRKLPWREAKITRDPYAVLVSEIMLQQTQVDRVVPKYLAWLESFPDWQALASAKKSDVLKYWSGLGYNSRALRLQLLARVIVEEFHGKLPSDEETLRKLPGIGPYTAGAIRAFAFCKPGMFLDVNVERVIKRVFYTRRQAVTIDDVKSTLIKLQQKTSPRMLGNAMMDLGSIYCAASKPNCEECPLIKLCKSKGERPEEENAREKKRQSTFLHSNRWWRGQILKQLHDGPKKKKELFAAIRGGGRESFDGALDQLRKERIVSWGSTIRILE